jgi:hypothetical protein
MGRGKKDGSSVRLRSGSCLCDRCVWTGDISFKVQLKKLRLSETEHNILATNPTYKPSVFYRVLMLLVSLIRDVAHGHY